MAIYSLTTNTTVATTTAPGADIKASSTNSPRLMETGINLAAATASVFGLGRPANDGSVAQTAPVVVLAENPNDPAGNSGMAVAWSTAPTVPANFFRRAAIAGAVGAGIIWTFPRGLIMATSHGLTYWNITANSANTNIWVVVDE